MSHQKMARGVVGAVILIPECEAWDGVPMSKSAREQGISKCTADYVGMIYCAWERDKDLRLEHRAGSSAMEFREFAFMKV